MYIHCIIHTVPLPAVLIEHSVDIVNGSVVIHWELPRELSALGEGVRVEVNVSGEWVEVGIVTHAISPPLPFNDDLYTFYLRVSIILVVCLGHMLLAEVQALLKQVGDTIPC